MSKDLKIVEKYNKLKEQLNKWNHLYYVLDNPIVDDIVYDEAMQELIAIENLNPQLISLDSPSQKIGGTTIDKFNKINHSSPMMSLANAFNKEDLEHFDSQIKNTLGKNEYSFICELKIDGVSIAIHYEEGFFKLAITRGDGLVGEDVTNNVKKIKTIPLSILEKKPCEIRGEIFLSKKQFNKINEENLKNNKEPFANPRNVAAGTIRQLNSQIIAERNIDAFFYFWMNKDVLTQEESLEKLKTNKLKINKETKVCQTIEDVYKFCLKYEEKRQELDYEIDGIVIKINEKKYYDEIGKTSKFPKWAIAYKFKPELASTKLIDIIPTVGRTGRITYNARLEPINLSGSIIQNATLHNYNYIQGMDIRIGDIVQIKKAGDIIPKVLTPIISKRNKDLKKWEKINYCPICNSKLEIFENEKDQYCLNIQCPARVTQSIIHFVSKKAMNIEGLGEKVIEILIQKKLISNIVDIYKLNQKEAEIISLEGFGKKAFTNMIQAIEDSKELPLNNVLFGLGIRHIGEKVSKQLSKKYKDIETISQLNETNIIKDHEIGPKITESLTSYFNVEKNLETIKELQSLGVKFLPMKEIKVIENPYQNKKFVLTGTLSISRDEMVKKLEMLGAEVIGTISKNIDFLLAGTNAGSKLEKAKKMNIQIINEKDILNYF